MPIWLTCLEPDVNLFLDGNSFLHEVVMLYTEIANLFLAIVHATALFPLAECAAPTMS